MCLVNQKGPVTSLSQPWVDTFVYSHNTLLYNTSNTLVGAGTVRVTGMAWNKNPAKHPFSKSSTFVLMSSISLLNYILGSNHLTWWWSLIKNERKENLHVYYFKIKFCLQGNWHVKYFHVTSSQYKLNNIGIVLSNSV